MNRSLTAQSSCLVDFRGRQRALETSVFPFAPFIFRHSEIVDHSLSKPELWKKKLEYFFQSTANNDSKERQDIMRLIMENNNNQQVLNFDKYKLPKFR